MYVGVWRNQERVRGKDHALERRCLLMSLWLPTEIELNHYALRSREDGTQAWKVLPSCSRLFPKGGRCVGVACSVVLCKQG